MSVNALPVGSKFSVRIMFTEKAHRSGLGSQVVPEAFTKKSPDATLLADL